MSMNVVYIKKYFWTLIKTFCITDMGRVLVGIQVTPDDSDAFESFKNNLGYHVIDETENPVYTQFLK